jgi:hypothetical protein
MAISTLSKEYVHGEETAGKRPSLKGKQTRKVGRVSEDINVALSTAPKFRLGPAKSGPR